MILGAAGGAVAQPAPRTLRAPVSPTCITSPYGPRVLANDPLADKFHYGLDLRAAVGTTVHAVAPGQVISVDRRGAGGLEVRVRHNGFTALYAHLGRLTPSLARGKRTVAAGEALGVIGLSGLTYGPHLYFELWINGNRVDPEPYFGIPFCD